MGISSPDNLTQELAALGIPNPFAELGLTRADNMLLFGRAYLGNMTVSDIVTAPYGQDLYRRCASDDAATVLTFDPTGEGSRRSAPPEDHTYAVVQSPTYSRFWRRLEAAVDLQADDGSFTYGDAFIATYGIPAGAEEVAQVPAEAEPERFVFDSVEDWRNYHLEHGSWFIGAFLPPEKS